MTDKKAATPVPTTPAGGGTAATVGGAAGCATTLLPGSRAVWVVLVFVMLFAAGVRLQGLGRKTFHHDESIHANWAYQIYHQGRFSDTNPGEVVYRYDPVYHGPVLYHIGAFFFLLFGDNDATARLPVALCGIFLLYLVWLLLSEEKNHARWWALAVAGLSPTLIYYARFLVHDTYLATWYLGLMVFGIRYWKYGRTRDFFLTVLFLGLMYDTKTNSYMHGFIIGFSAVVYGVGQLVLSAEARRAFLRKALGERIALTQLAGLYALFSAAAFLWARFYYEANLGPGGYYYGPLVTHTDYANRNFGGWIFSSSQEGYSNAARWFFEHWGKFSTGYWLVFIFVCVAFLVVMGLLRGSRWGDGGAPKSAPEPDVALAGPINAILEHWMILLSLVGLVFLYCFLFTTMFANPLGMVQGVRDYVSYWFGANETHRLAGGPDYYYYRLLLYDFTGMILLVVGILWFCLAQLWESFTSRPAPAKGRQGEAGGPAPAFLYYLGWFLVGLVLFWIVIYLLFGREMKYVAVPHPPMPKWKVGLWTLAAASLFYPYLKLWQRRPLPAMLIFWSLASLIIYAFLGEKGPWLMTHQALPLALLAGVTLGDLFARLSRPAARAALAVPLVALLLLEMRAAVYLNVYYEDDAREAMVYVQTAPEIKTLLSEVDRMAEQSGLREKFPIAVGNEANWPFVWYFRNYRFSPAITAGKNTAVVIEHADPAGANHENLMRKLGDGFTYRKMRLQNWWDNPRSKLDSYVPGNAGYLATPELRRMLVNYFLYREPWSYKGQPEALGSKDIYVYIRKDAVDKEVAPVKRDLPTGSTAPMRLVADGSFGQNGVSPVSFNQPRGLSWRQGRPYVTDSKNGRVVILDATGRQVSEVGRGILSSEYSGPSTVVSDGAGGFWVTDTWRMQPPGQLRSRLLHFGPNAEILKEIAGAENSGFFAPRGMALGPGGEIIVTDTGNHHLKVFDANGNHLRTIGQPGRGPGAFTEPVGVVVGQGGLVYVADAGNRRIQCLDLMGRFVRQWNVPGFLGEDAAIANIEPMLAVDARGRIYATDSSTDQIYVFTPDGTNMQVYGTTGQLSDPKGIAVDETGRIYVSQTALGRVVRFAPVNVP
ncbi:TIGR03663 family protein [bacterium]|nr:TIGR03663 family protein [bacterium]